MLRATATLPTQATPVPPAALADTNSLPQLLHEPSRAGGPRTLRYLRHPQKLALRGIPVTCPTCRAERDWLLINQGPTTWTFCRCGTHWREPEITRAAFETLPRLPDTTAYPTVAHALAAMGFDGSFTGIYLE